MNDIQKQFLEILEQYPNGLTLKQVYEKTGLVVKSGHVMVLVKNGLVRKNQTTHIYKLTKYVKQNETETFRNIVEDVEKCYRKYDYTTENGVHIYVNKYYGH